MKRILLIGSLLLAVCAARAAEPQHYMDIYAGAGVGSWGYTLSGGTTQIGNTYTAGFGYTWFFTPEVGLQTGLHATRLASYAMLTQTIEYPSLTDYQGEQYTHRVAFNNWRELQQTVLLQLPIGLRFRYFPQPDSHAGLHAAIGFNLSVPIRSTYRTTGALTHSAWYDCWQLELHDLPGRFGTETINQQSAVSGQLSPFNAMTYAEIGTSIRLGQRTQLIITAFAQYAVTDFLAVKRADRVPLGFARPDNGYTFMAEYNGLIGTDRVSTLAPWTAGLKLALSIWPGRTDEQKKQLLLRLAAEFPDLLPCMPVEEKK